MANNYGFTSVNQQVTSRSGGQNDLVNSINELNNKVTSGRVIDIILDNDHPRFDEFNGFVGLGTIIVDRVENTPSNVSNNSSVEVSLLSSTAMDSIPSLAQAFCFMGYILAGYFLRCLRVCQLE